jgi:SAM-dependent methyltransferase
MRGMVIKLLKFTRTYKVAVIALQIFQRSTMSPGKLYRQYIYSRPFRNIRRDNRTTCWCGGKLLPLKGHPNYGTCSECGCYVSRHPPLQQELAKLYSMDYWQTRQEMKNIPTIETRADLYKADGRLEYWLSIIKKYGPTNGKVIEVGCAPGILLAELQKSGFECIGVEPDHEVSEWIRKNMGIAVYEGFFPCMELPSCDLFLAFDLIEHVPDPKGFICEIHKLLNPNGIAVIQTPIQCRDYTHPFKKRPDFFDDLEHLFLFTDKAMLKLAETGHMEIVALEDSMGGTLGHICVLRKKQ